MMPSQASPADFEHSPVPFAANPISTRAVVVALALVAILTWLQAVLRLERLVGEWAAIGGGNVPTAAMLALFVLLGFNILCRRAGRERWRFNQAELLAAYSLVAVSLTIGTMSGWLQLPAVMMTQFHYDTPENRWGELIGDRLPAWLVPEGIRQKVGPYVRRLARTGGTAAALQPGLVVLAPGCGPALPASESTTSGAREPPAEPADVKKALPRWPRHASELVDWKVFAPKWESARTYFTDHHLPQYKKNFGAFFDGRSLPPWGLLLKPLAAWVGFSLVLYLTFFCMMSLVRRQWVENERLAFPVLVVPLAVSRDGGNSGLFRSRAFQVGFWIAFVYAVHLSMGQFIPGFPRLMLNVNLLTFLPNKPWNTIQPYMMILAFNVTGFALAFFVPKNVILSFLLFNVLMTMLYPLGSVMGWGQGNPQSPIAMARWPFYGEVGFGAFTGVLLLALWLGRRHVRDIVVKAFTGTRRIDDSGEPMPYRLAFFGALTGFAILVGFARLAGMRLSLAAAFLGIFFAYVLSITRVRAETALAATHGPHIWSATPDQLFRAYMGVENIAPQSLAVMGHMSWICQTPEGIMPPHQVEGLKMTHEARGRPRKLIAAMILAVLVALPVCVWATWSGFYYTGEASVMGNKPSVLGARIHRGVAQDIVSKRPVDTSGIIATCAGAVFCLFLGFMRSRFLWWPLHPVGFALGWSYWVNYYWFSWFLAYVFKSLALKYAGVDMYRKITHLCIGLLVGTYLESALWVLLTLVQTKGPVWGARLWGLLSSLG